MEKCSSLSVSPQRVGQICPRLDCRRRDRKRSTIDPETAGSDPGPPSLPWSFEGREFLVVILEAEWNKTSESNRELTKADVIVFEK